MTQALTHTTTAQVREALLARNEIALLDVREEDLFAQGHPLFAANLPLGRLELDAYLRIPRLNTNIVVYDNGEGLAAMVEADQILLVDVIGGAGVNPVAHECSSLSFGCCGRG